MSTPTVNTRHRVTGKLQRLTEDQIKPFADVLEVVPDDAKPLEPGLFKPGTVGQFEPPAEPPAAPKSAASKSTQETTKPGDSKSEGDNQ